MIQKRVLIAPLDWGLGHATRCIPIINSLIKQNCEVIIAGSGSSLKLLQIEYPTLYTIELPGYNPIYPVNSSMASKIFFQLPKFINTIKKEHAMLDQLITKHQVDIVISDNRYGCWSRKAKCIFITHQTNILTPKGFGWLSGIINYVNHKLIKQFSECWVPDFDNSNNLTGALSHRSNLNVRFIGILSRFTKCLPDAGIKYKLLVILSGPEPQRSILEDIIMKQIRLCSFNVLIVRGITESCERRIVGQVEIVDFVSAIALNEIICKSDIIIARSGYSTIMDLMKLEKKSILIPTPGQTEQLYLAKRIHDQSAAFSIDQHSFNLQEALHEVEKTTGFVYSQTEENLLERAIAELIK